MQRVNQSRFSAIPVELNVNPSGVVIEIHDTCRDYGTFAPAIGQ
jgi:hypothetical protein